MNPVEGHSNLYKDPDTGVIVNRETTGRDRYRIAKRQAMSQIDTEIELEELKKTVSELGELKGEIDELKSLIHQLLRK